jgi:hypothetical protein
MVGAGGRAGNNGRGVGGGEEGCGSQIANSEAGLCGWGDPPCWYDSNDELPDTAIM